MVIFYEIVMGVVTTDQQAWLIIVHFIQFSQNISNIFDIEIQYRSKSRRTNFHIYTTMILFIS